MWAVNVRRSESVRVSDVSAAPGAVHPVAAGHGVQRARVLGVGRERAAALRAAVLAAHAAV